MLWLRGGLFSFGEGRAGELDRNKDSGIPIPIYVSTVF